MIKAMIQFHLLFIKWKNLSVKIGMEISLMKNVRDTKSFKHAFLVRLCGLSSLWVYVNVDFMCKNNEWYYWPALWLNLCHTFDTWFMHRCMDFFLIELLCQFNIWLGFLDGKSTYESMGIGIWFLLYHFLKCQVFPS